jgi:hypothetical protein
VADIDTDDSGLTLHVVQLPTRGLRAGARINFTFFWTDTETWDGRDYVVAIV